MSEEFEELMDLPQEWINVLERMPEVREVFIEDKEDDEDEMIPIYFFSYFEDDIKECEPFFTCFERGKEVFNNFYSIYGSDNDEDKTLDDEQIIDLVKKHIEGMKYLLELNDNDTYDFDNMEIKLLSKEEYIQNKNSEDINIEDNDIRNECSDSMLDNVLPEEEENPISAFHEALYEKTQNYYILYYILWPLGKIDDISNPFDAYKKLWENNIEIHLLSKDLMVAVK